MSSYIDEAVDEAEEGEAEENELGDFDEEGSEEDVQNSGDAEKKDEGGAQVGSCFGLPPPLYLWSCIGLYICRIWEVLDHYTVECSFNSARLQQSSSVNVCFPGVHVPEDAALVVGLSNSLLQ